MLTAAQIATMTPDAILAHFAAQQREADAKVAIAQAEAAKAKAKAKSKEFDPNTCAIYIKEGGRTVNINLGAGVGRFGIINLFPEGAFRLEKLLATGRFQAFVDANRAKLLEMHAAYLADPKAGKEEAAAAE